MISLTQPSKAKISKLYEKSSHQLSYLEVGESLNQKMPSGYYHIDVRMNIGTGYAFFNEIKERFKKWDMIRLPWITIHQAGEMKAGEIVIFTVHPFFVKFTVMDKIVDFIESENEIKMAYGTLDEHIEIGEELFQVSYNPNTDEVTYAIRSFSRIKNPIIRIGGLFVRRLQNKFVRDCLKQFMQ